GVELRLGEIGTVLSQRPRGTGVDPVVHPAPAHAWDNDPASLSRIRRLTASVTDVAGLRAMLQYVRRLARRLRARSVRGSARAVLRGAPGHFSGPGCTRLDILE